MKNYKKIICFVLVFSFIGLSSVNIWGAENDLDEEKIKEISDISGIEESNIREDVLQVSKRMGISYGDALNILLDEMRSQETIPLTSTRAGYTLPAGLMGNAFYTQAYFSSWNHGHAGLFSAPETIIHAPGGDKLSREEKRQAIIVGGGDYYLKYKYNSGFVAMISKARSLTGKGYSMSIDNKSCTNNNVVNCSQLVYCAYLAGGYNVDSNGGLFVSPADIRDSSHFVKQAY